MNNFEKILLTGAFVVLLSIMGYAALIPHASDQTYGSPLEPFSTSGTVNASTTCNAVTSTQIAAANSNRTFFYLSNGGTSTMSICFAATCQAQTGIQLYATSTANTPGSYIMNPSNVYRGPISCIVNQGGTSTLSELINQ